jgi:hypothetical protein
MGVSFVFISWLFKSLFSSKAKSNTFISCESQIFKGWMTRKRPQYGHSCHPNKDKMGGLQKSVCLLMATLATGKYSLTERITF